MSDCSQRAWARPNAVLVQIELSDGSVIDSRLFDMDVEDVSRVFINGVEYVPSGGADIR